MGNRIISHPLGVDIDLPTRTREIPITSALRDLFTTEGNMFVVERYIFFLHPLSANSILCWERFAKSESLGGFDMDKTSAICYSRLTVR